MIYLFHGENTRAAKQQIHKLVDRFKASTGSDFGLHRFDEDSDPEAIKEALTATPMFSEASLVVLENPSRSKGLIDALSDALESIPDKTVLAVYDPEIDKRTGWFKTLQKCATVKEFTAKSRPQLLKWVYKTAQAHDVPITKDAAELLVDHAGEDERRLDNEIAKLANSGEEIGQEQVKQLVRPNPQHTVFALLDALSAGDIHAALEYFDGLRVQNVHELEILAMLGWQMRTFLTIASAGAVPDQQLTKDHGINPYVLKKAKPVAGRVSPEALERAYGEIIATDYAIKTSQHEPHILLEQLITRLGEYMRE